MENARRRWCEEVGKKALVTSAAREMVDSSNDDVS
jgi:hypothetical protein